MKFVIGKVSFFESLGYNTKYWRKSINGEKTICHIEYAEILIYNLEDNSEVQIIEASEAYEVMATEEWSLNSTEEVYE